MKYTGCNEKCKPEEKLHWLGDRMMTEGKPVCVGCKTSGIPHTGFAYPCYASASGSHHFTELTAERNK